MRFLLSSCEWRPWMLLNVLQCTKQPSLQRIIWFQMSVVLRVSNPGGPVSTFQKINENGSKVSKRMPIWEALRNVSLDPALPLQSVKGRSLPASLSCLLVPQPLPPEEKLRAVRGPRDTQERLLTPTSFGSLRLLAWKLYSLNPFS